MINKSLNTRRQTSVCAVIPWWKWNLGLKESESREKYFSLSCKTRLETVAVFSMQGEGWVQAGSRPPCRQGNKLWQASTVTQAPTTMAGLLGQKNTSIQGPSPFGN